ncbi:MAG: acyl-ACP desaturase [Rhodococcus sp.]|nr:acyl-ACP desaturase [Rhodococcus sp. (in: high G+C Gram-positive bacteria)]
MPTDINDAQPREFTDSQLLKELEAAAQENLDRHIAAADDWQAHDFVPWDSGRNFAFMGGEDWSAEQSQLSDVEALALTVSVLIADNMPSHHRELAQAFGLTGPWWTWVGRWTAEENRQSIVLRNYLVLTRAVDPVALERDRMEHMVRGFDLPPLHLADMLAHSAFEEAAAAVRHRNTARLGSDPVVAAITDRIAQDDELQATFYSNLVAASLDIAPDQTVLAVASAIDSFEVPRVDLLDGSDSTARLAEAGIYDPARQNEDVFAPLLRDWKIAERTGLGAEAEKARQKLAALI